MSTDLINENQNEPGTPIAGASPNLETPVALFQTPSASSAVSSKSFSSAAAAVHSQLFETVKPLDTIPNYKTIKALESEYLRWKGNGRLLNLKNLMDPASDLIELTLASKNLWIEEEGHWEDLNPEQLFRMLFWAILSPKSTVV